MRRAKRVVQKLVCSVCGNEFTPPAAKNYEYRKARATCSDPCRWIAVEEAKKRAKEESLRKMDGKKPVKTVAEKPINYYRLVHEKARMFAGCELEEKVDGDGDE